MEIWLETDELPLIQQAQEMGLLHGITIKSENQALLEKILKVQNGPVSMPIKASSAGEMIRKAESFFSSSNRIVIQIPVTKEGLKTIYTLHQKSIPVIATPISDLNQVLLAARAGADYIAPFFSVICEEDRDGLEQIKKMLKALNHYRFPSKLIAASLCSSEQVSECVEIGTHAVSLNEFVFNGLLENHLKAF